MRCLSMFVTQSLTPWRALSDRFGSNVCSRNGYESKWGGVGRMQPGIVGLRGAITALWEDDLRAVREDRYDTDRGKEALAFIQRFNATVAQLRVPIQQAWGAGGLVHVADNPDVAGPGQRVSHTRIKLRNHGEAVVGEALAYTARSPKPDPGLGVDRENKMAEIRSLAFIPQL